MPDLMPLIDIPDFEERLARQDAFWECTVIDRPVVSIVVPRPRPAVPPPAPPASVRERWLNADYVAAAARAEVLNAEYLGDALPSVWPNLGPEWLAAAFGLELHFDERTAWSTPLLRTWSDLDEVRLSEENFYWRKAEELTAALLQAGRGLFYTGLTDFHPGGDWAAALRGPEQLALDLVQAPGEVRRLLAMIDEAYPRIYHHFRRRLAEEGQPVSTWPGIVSIREWYVVSNDFSCLVSREMFEDFFLPGIVAECRFLEASIYHLDGPGALHHLDALLRIPELSAVQWVWGAGNGRASDWLDVYRRCQAAGKALQIWIQPDELETIVENLRPEGVWLQITDVPSRRDAQALLERVARWK